MPKSNFFDTEMRKAIGAVVRERRIKLCWSQRSLGQRTGLEQRHVWGIEHGRAGLSLESLVVIAKPFHLTASELLKLAGY
jgi:transcriptional regulator with XRE-family HTH domain